MKMMIHVIRHRDGTIETVNSINSISHLENSDLVIVPRGHKIRKHLRGVRNVNNVKDLYSVKMIKEALAKAEAKAAKKTTIAAHYCMICGEYTSTGNDGLCNECRI